MAAQVFEYMCTLHQKNGPRHQERVKDEEIEEQQERMSEREDEGNEMELNETNKEETKI